ncbi:hypothetical protein M3G91_27770 [Micromonospora chalcea]|uniref:hypothetical protein n=1 Tax=Micromonospora chalcea TaxID=1874 RepID=UPI0021A3B00E|nr:hypothetical protein [Micromonospora chalcea]MCT2281407.1 hypothetical protein [Micromonospora chalcea]
MIRPSLLLSGLGAQQVTGRSFGVATPLLPFLNAKKRAEFMQVRADCPGRPLGRSLECFHDGRAKLLLGLAECNLRVV